MLSKNAIAFRKKIIAEIKKRGDGRTEFRTFDEWKDYSKFGAMVYMAASTELSSKDLTIQKEYHDTRNVTKKHCWKVGSVSFWDGTHHRDSTPELYEQLTRKNSG